MYLKPLGLTDSHLNYLNKNQLSIDHLGRIVKQNHSKFTVKMRFNDILALVPGSLKYSIKNQVELPSVGDWVIIKNKKEATPYIKTILPRKSIIKRKNIYKLNQEQAIASNVDFGLIMQDIKYDFNLNRLDRFLTICYASSVIPIIILTKIDLVKKNTINACTKRITERFQGIKILMLSNKSLEGLKEVKHYIKRGKTYCCIGSSGAGKSSFINNLIGEKVMLTKSLRKKSNKGQHTTSHRELFILKNSGILIDTPGIRELGISIPDYNLNFTFKKIFNIGKSCKFSNCNHISEPNCEVKNAVKTGAIEQSLLDNYHKMHNELTMQQKYKRIKR